MSLRTGHDGAYLQSHLGGRDRRIFVSGRPAWSVKQFQHILSYAVRLHSNQANKAKSVQSLKTSKQTTE